MPIRAVACVLALLLLVPATAAAAGRARTAKLLGQEMRRAGASAGALAVDVDSGRTIYSLRADTTRMPASVEKLYTSATALRRLGASGRIDTTVLAETAPTVDGVVEGDLYLRGGGDPTFDAFDSNRL